MKRSGKVRPQKVTIAVAEILVSPRRILSRAGHVKSRLNLGGPSAKAKYSLVTDSEPVP